MIFVSGFFFFFTFLASFVRAVSDKTKKEENEISFRFQLSRV